MARLYALPIVTVVLAVWLLPSVKLFWGAYAPSLPATAPTTTMSSPELVATALVTIGLGVAALEDSTLSSPVGVVWSTPAKNAREYMGKLGAESQATANVLLVAAAIPAPSRIQISMWAVGPVPRLALAKCSQNGSSVALSDKPQMRISPLTLTSREWAVPGSNQ